MHNINKPELVSKVLINVLFISVFIGVFFFTYGSYIEKKIVKEQMIFLSKDIQNLFSLFGKNVNNAITTKLNELELPDLSHEDNKAKQNNIEIKKKAFMFLSLFSLFVAFLVYFIYTKYGNNTYELNKIISENIIILFAIAITEFVFLTYFGARFISINPSVVKLTLLKLLRERNII